jgi:hypothetical protein
MSASMPNFFCRMANYAPSLVSENEYNFTNLMQDCDGLIFVIYEIKELFLFLSSLHLVICLRIVQVL